MKPRAPDSDLRTLTLAMSDSDDDDFQNPSQAISITQNLILSSLTNPNPSSQPLIPSNGTRRRKPLKPAAAGTGKENRRVPQIITSDSRVSNGCEVKKPVCAERRNPSAPIGSNLVEIALTSNSDSCISSNCDRIKSSNLVTIECNEGAAINEGNLCHLPSTISKFADNRGFKEGKGSYYSMSIEARLLESRAKAVSCGVEGGCLEGDGCRDFEPGTQLNALMDLCYKMDEEGGSSCGIFPFHRNDFCVESSELQGNGLVQCPLCGTDITSLSEELRQVHTNHCLDKDETPKESVHVGELKSNSPRQLVDVNPVLEWLRILGLSRYEEAFVREEIDWETLQWLTEEDLLSIGVVALGPRKKIVHALNEFRKRNTRTHDIEKDVSNTTANKNIKSSIPGNMLITEYFQGAAVKRKRVNNLSKPLDAIERSKNSVLKRTGSRNYNNRGKVVDTPPWCCVPGTPFRVDAFRYLRGDCSHWFLTHFHIDHYQGLTRNFCHGKIYCSSITAHLVNMKIGVPWDRLHILPLNQNISIAGVNLTCLDANHCPGSIIILFEPPNSKAVLHTGDFRFSTEMAKSSILQSCHVHTLILDTTYCNPQYDFPKQEAVIQFVIEAIQAEAFNPKTLFLIGTYTIGKERLFLEVARLLRKKIYVGAAKLCLLRCLGLPEDDMQWLTTNEIESHIHVVPMWTIASFKRMKHISNQYSSRFNLIVAFSPTGWTFGKGKKKSPGRRWQQGTIIRYEVPYSEHCSFTELREFVQFISPEHIIPSVNNDGPESVDAIIATLLSDP